MVRVGGEKKTFLHRIQILFIYLFINFFFWGGGGAGS